MVDSIVVGQFAGQDALAAVGTSDPVMNLLILGVTGLCIGASVIMSNCFGAGKNGRIKARGRNDTSSCDGVVSNHSFGRLDCLRGNLKTDADTD